MVDGIGILMKRGRRLERHEGHIADSDKVAGDEYLGSCGHYHVWDPRPWAVKREELMNRATQKMADAVDAEILRGFL